MLPNPVPLQPFRPEESSADELSLAERRRSRWRRRLVDGERGLTEGFRRESAFFAHFFTGSIALSAAAVLGVSLVQWCLVAMCIASVVAAELFQQSVRVVTDSLIEDGHLSEETARVSRRLGTAAILVVMLGASLTILMIIGGNLWDRYSAL